MTQKEKDELFNSLREFRVVLEPEMNKIVVKIRTAVAARNPQEEEYWRSELKKLQDYYLLCQKQSISIKLQANQSKSEGHILDLHCLTVDESLIALKEKISECVSQNPL